MAVATAIIVGAITAGATVGGAVVAAKGQEHAAETAAASADKAAALQTASTDKALAETIRQHDLERADLAPYRALGAGATGRLGELWGFPAPPPTPSPIRNAGTPQVSVQASAIGPGGLTIPGGVGMANPTAPQTFGRPMGALPGTGLTVKLQAPTGEVQDVPSEQAPELIRRGARQIG